MITFRLASYRHLEAGTVVYVQNRNYAFGIGKANCEEQERFSERIVVGEDGEPVESNSVLVFTDMPTAGELCRWGVENKFYMVVDLDEYGYAAVPVNEDDLELLQ